MEADFAVELGADDETLEFPWSSPDGKLRYHDLKRQPELLLNIEEAHGVPELGEFLAALNSPSSPLETAKCDVWFTEQINPEEQIFGASCKFGSYVDFLFSDPGKRFEFSDHEQLAKQAVQLLRRVPEIPAAAEFLVRRCYYHEAGEARDAFYITCYVFGYGDEQSEARQRWAIGMKLVENALRQMGVR